MSNDYFRHNEPLIHVFIRCNWTSIITVRADVTLLVLIE